MASPLEGRAAKSDVTTAEELSLHLNDWTQRYDSVIEPILTEIHLKPYLKEVLLCSPDCKVLRDSVWTAYDALEGIRVERKFAKYDWQVAIEKDRVQIEGMKLSMDRTFADHDWAQVPLGMVLERFEGSPSPWNRESDDADTSLDRWLRFQDAFAGPAEFRESLSVTQWVSGTILRDWWSCSYQDSKVFSVAIDSIKVTNSSPSQKTYFFGEPHPCAEVFEQVRTSVYNSVMLALFYEEFNPEWWFPYLKATNFIGLRRNRQKAVEHATAQRIAYTSYVSLTGPRIHAGRSYLSSLDKPCPWLDKKHRQTGMPYYLWNVERKQTVVASELEFEPEYYCISHTWGRWRKEATAIEGVPWRVPQNQRFDVKMLPEHLQRIQSRPKFVWLDLFCIPQDGSRKADEEIDRQAIIFQNAARCIAWMNDIREWEYTVKALDWLGVAYLHSTTCPGVYDTEYLLKELSHESDAPNEFFTAMENPEEVIQAMRDYMACGEVGSPPSPMLRIIDKRPMQPACWFSSLWTLQEAMLCPNLTFVTRDWIPPQDRSGVSLPFNALFTFIHVVANHWLGDKQYEAYTTGSITSYSRYEVVQDPPLSQDLGWPDGPRQLRILGKITRIDSFLANPSPIGLLLLANSRVSTGSRAPAIMSALGVTDWYKPGEDNDKDLVLDCFPLRFIKEAAEKLGASFYLSTSQDTDFPAHSTVSSHSISGSMMPFSATSGWFSTITGMQLLDAYAPHDHPATKSWTIDRIGSVIIKRAGILALSKDTTRSSQHEMLIQFMNRDHSDKTTSFGDWSKEFENGVETYAVSLTIDEGNHRGVILQGRREGSLKSAYSLLSRMRFPSLKM